MVLKTGPDRPVQPRTGVQSSPVRWKNRKIRKMGQKPETAGSTIKTANRSGWTSFGPVPLITKLHRFGLTPVTPLPHAGDPSASRRLPPLPHAGDPSASRCLPPLPHSGDSLSLVPFCHWTRAVSSLDPCRLLTGAVSKSQPTFASPDPWLLTFPGSPPLPLAAPSPFAVHSTATGWVFSTTAFILSFSLSLNLGKFVLDLVCVWCCECLCEMSIFSSSSYSIF